MSSVANPGQKSYFCAAPGCSSDDRKRGRYGYMAGVHFFAFPTQKKAPNARKKWVELLRRENFDPDRKARVCSRHFVDGKPSKEHPYPELFDYNNFKESKQPRPITSIQKRMETPSIQQNMECMDLDSTANYGQCTETTANSNLQCEVPDIIMVEDSLVSPHEPNGCWPVMNEVFITDMDTTVPQVPETIAQDHCYYGENIGRGTCTAEISTQTDITVNDLEVLEQEKKRLDDPDKLLRDLFVEKVTKNDSSVQQYLGVPSKKTLDGTFDILDRSSPDLKYWSGQNSSTKKKYQANPHQHKTGPKRKLSRYQEFIMTLIRIRLALSTFCLADLFGVSSARVSQVVATWLNYMAVIFQPLLKWPSQKVIKKFRPRSFRLKYPNVTGIIDCTEFFIRKPRNPTAQSQTFSAYKQHNTYKSLVCISPSGAITFISKLWGGNVSDRHITKECGFLDLIRTGDEIMADRGFVVRDLLLKKKAKLIIPPFTKKCNWGKGKHLSASDIQKTKSIAHFRIHVERAIGRLKTFRILSNTMPLNMKPLANQILVVSAFLSNLQKPLVKK